MRASVRLDETRVLVVDSQPTMRLGVRYALEAEEDLVPVGEAGEAEDALDLAEEASPDVVVVDPDIEGDGKEFLKELKALPDSPGVVVHTARNSEEDVFASRLAGAESFVHKEESTGRLIQAIRETRRGKRVWFLGEERDDPDPPAHGESERLLTGREKEVFALLIRRRSNAEIADELCIGIQTTKNHVSSVLRKLGVARREELL